MRTNGHALSTALLGGALLACSGDSPAPPEACFNCAPAPPSEVRAGIVVQNLTDHEITVAVRDLPALQIDRKILEGSLSVPIGPATRGPATDFRLQPQMTTFLGAPIGVLRDANVVPETGGVIRIGDGPFTLAVGKGLVAVRTRDGADVLEAEDPRSATLLPVESDISQCEAARFGEELDERPAGIRSGEPLVVLSITREGSCRVLQVGTSVANAVEYRVCVPDAAFPFADDAELTMLPIATDGLRLNDGAGSSLDLVPVRFDARAPASALGLAFAFAEDATCATIEALCADTVVPAKLLVSFDGKTSNALAVGESVVDPLDATRTLFLAGARSRPAVLASPGCPARPTTAPFATTDAFVALVKRAK